MNMIWKHLFTCVIAGPTGCGKTMWVREFLKYKAIMTEPTPHEVVWCYAEWQAVYEQSHGVCTLRGHVKVDLSLGPHLTLHRTKKAVIGTL